MWAPIAAICAIVVVVLPLVRWVVRSAVNDAIDTRTEPKFHQLSLQVDDVSQRVNAIARKQIEKGNNGP